AIDIGGTPHVAVFSSPAAVAALFGDDTPVIALGGRDLLAAFAGRHLILNPASPPAKALTPPEIAALLDGSLLSPQGQPVTVAAKTRCRGGGGCLRAEATESRRATLATTKGVRAAYVA